MAGMGDMARMMAAGGGDGGMGGDVNSPDMESQDPNAPEEGPEMGGDPGEMMEQGIAMIEAGLEQLPGDLAEKARKLLEGLKEISAQGAAAGGTPDDQSDPSQDQPSSDPGMGAAPTDPMGGAGGGGMTSA